MNDLRLPAASSPPIPALVTAAGNCAQFFVLNIRNPHTRRTYARGAGIFAWCEQHGARSIAKVQPLHVGTYVEMLTRSQSAAAAKWRRAGKTGNTPKLWQLPSSHAAPIAEKTSFLRKLTYCKAPSCKGP